MAAPVTLNGYDQLVSRLAEVQDASEDISDVWGDLAGLWEDRETDVFASQGYGKWGPPAPSTLRTHQSLLVDTGVMREGLTIRRPIWSVKNAAAFGAPKVDRRVMNVAVLNQAGHGSAPPRPPVPPLRGAETKKWLRVVEEHMQRALS